MVKKTKKSSSKSNQNKNGKKGPKNKGKNKDLPSDNQTPVVQNDEKKDEITTVISKNGCVVDPFLDDSLSYSVVPAKPSQYHSPFYSCTLNYSNLQNNNNKFYIIQLLQNEINKKFYIFLRWGRVGRKGQTNLLEFSSEEEAINYYNEKFNGKIEYGYVEIKLNFETAKLKKEIEQNTKSFLDPYIIELIEQLYDINCIDEQMKQIGYDSERLPLGMLSKENLTEGSKILSKIEKVIEGKEKGNLKSLSSEFYTIIPHNFGFQHMSYFIINTLDLLKEKIEMIDTLKDVHAVTKILEAPKDDKMNAIEGYYYNLKCDIKIVETNSEEYEIINNYLQASTSLPSSPKLTLIRAFELKCQNENDGAKFENKMLLWYGTRIGNYVSLISEGFHLPSPESPSTAYMFGKGIYFADMSVKASASCHPSNGIGFLMLCEVSLDNIEKRTFGDYNLPSTMKEGMNSVLGCGLNVPDESGTKVLNNIKIPLGPPVKSDIKSFFGFNQYIVYDTSRIKIRYLVKIKFN